MEKEELRLITRDGDIIVVEYPTKFADEFFNELYGSTNTFWAVTNYDGVVATFKENSLSYINMNQIIGLQQHPI